MTTSKKNSNKAVNNANQQELTKQDRINMLFNGIDLAHSKGAFDLSESATLQAIEEMFKENKMINGLTPIDALVQVENALRKGNKIGAWGKKDASALLDSIIGLSKILRAETENKTSEEAEEEDDE